MGSRLRVTSILLAALALLGTACASDTSGTAGTSPTDPGTTSASESPAGPTELALVMGTPGEFDFSPTTLTMPAGEDVILTIRNNGRKEHEWMVGRDHMDEPGYQTDMLAMMEPTAMEGDGYKMEGFEGEEPMGGEHMEEGGDGHMGAEIEIEAGGFVTLRMHVPEDASGEWEMGCFIPQHYESGMKGTITIT